MTNYTAQGKALWNNGFIFAIAMWLLSRLLILSAMMLLAPALPAPPGGVIPKAGWEVFDWWDIIFYKQIVTVGYEYAHDKKGHNVALHAILFTLCLVNVALGIRSADTLVQPAASFSGFTFVFDQITRTCLT